MKVFLNVISAKSSNSEEVIGFAVSNERNNNKIYAESNSYNPTKVSIEEYDRYIKNLLFNNYTNIKQNSEDSDILYIKDDITILRKEVIDYFIQLFKTYNERITVWVKDSYEWNVFLTKVLGVGLEIPSLLDFIDVDACTLNTLLSISNIPINLELYELFENKTSIRNDNMLIKLKYLSSVTDILLNNNK